MRHTQEQGEQTFAVHEVYFGSEGQVIAYTEDAISPHAATVSKLREAIILLLKREKPVSGDLGYVYPHEDIREWLNNIDLPPIEYELYFLSE